MKNKLSIFSVPTLFCVVLMSSAAYADPRPEPKKPEPREVHYNVQCYFKNHDLPEKYQSCIANSTFDKYVTRDGGEMTDDSDYTYQHPTLEVQCGDYLLYNDGGRRFTDQLGTRIQGRMGPVPAILLPRGALHTGRHVTASNLEVYFPELEKYARYSGKCHIWTNKP